MDYDEQDKHDNIKSEIPLLLLCLQSMELKPDTFESSLHSGGYVDTVICRYRGKKVLLVTVRSIHTALCFQTNVKLTFLESTLL